jgi:death-on-curing protein
VIWVPNSAQLLEVFRTSDLLIKPVFRDIGVIESALQRANLELYGTEMYVDIHTKVAAVIDSISRTHPLLDGNKRLGVVAAFVIFTMNDCRYVGTDNDADFSVSIAAEHLTLEEIAAHLRTLWLPGEARGLKSLPLGDNQV